MVSAPVIVDAGGVHDHAVGFYRDDRDLVSSVAPFLAEALDRGGAAIVIATEVHRRQLEAWLAAHGYSISSLQESGRYRAVDAHETLASFMRAGSLHAGDFASVIGGVLAEVGAGGGPVHAFGEMVSLLWDGGAVAAAIELESMWNDLAADHQFSLYCAYALASFEGSNDLEAAKQVCDQHSSVAALDREVGRELEPVVTIGADRCARVFIPAPAVVTDVRRFVRKVLRAWGVNDLLGEVELVASELASNSVLHARSPFEVSLSATATEITIAVRDVSTDLPEHLTSTPDRSGGRGIALVAELAQRWDTRHDAHGKTISATLARPTPA